jgi:ATP-binding cassette subfamily B protein
VSVPLREYVDLLYDNLRPKGDRALLLAALLLTSIGLQLLNPQILRGFIDAAVAGAPAGELTGAAVAFLAIALVQQGLSVASAYVGEDVGWTATNGLRRDLALHCLRLDMAFHNKRTPGEMIERVDGDVTALATFFSQIVIRVLGSALLLVGAIVMVFREDWRVGLALTAFVALVLTVLGRWRDVAVSALTAERESNARLFGFVEERLNGLDDLRANGAGPHVMRRLHGVLRELYGRVRRAWSMRALLDIGTSGMFAIGTILAVGLGTYLFLLGAITLGTVYLFYQYTEMLRNPIEQLTREMQELQRASAGIVRIRELLAIRGEIPDGPGAALPRGPLGLEFDHVWFGYGEEGHVLEDVSFQLAPGRLLGVVGRTGSGKTTLTRLLFRLYDPSSGTIRLGGAPSSAEGAASSAEGAASSAEGAASSAEGVDLRRMKSAELRRHVGLVTQEVQLFQASVRENLTFFDDAADDARIVALLDELGLGEWLARLPDGLDTELGASGAGLSAGEAQLLAVARAFLADPGLIVLDEPSSRLDPETELRIERAIARLLRGRTAIVIAHRLATVERADEILVMDDGRVVEAGDRARLAADPDSRFAGLLRAGVEEVLV